MLLSCWILIVLMMSVGNGQAAILDPMAVMRDDISRIKVMMETVGGLFRCIFIFALERKEKQQKVYNYHFFNDSRQNEWNVLTIYI